MIVPRGTHSPDDLTIWFMLPKQPGFRGIKASTLLAACIWTVVIEPETIRAWRLP